MDHAVESPADFREAFHRLLADAPAPAADAPRLLATCVTTPLGPMVAAAGEAGLCLLEYTGRQRLATQLQTLRRRFGAPVAPGANAHLVRMQAELDEYFSGRRRDFSVPLVYPGTPFEVRVWEALRAIPYGATRSYTQVARSIGSPDAVRAVGQANGRNRIAIVIPCHRVVNEGGGLGGYGGGLWRKERLLGLEQGQGALAS